MNSILQTLTPFAGIVALVGTYLLIMSHERANHFDRVRAKGRTAEGTVVELLPHPDAMSDRGKAPVVEFQSDRGIYKYVSTTYQHPSPYAIGQKVEVKFYFYKSRREVALPDDVPGDTPKQFLKWGIILCLLSYPLVLLRLFQLF